MEVVLQCTDNNHKTIGPILHKVHTTT